MSEESYDLLDEAERTVPEVTAAHQAWSTAAHQVLKEGSPAQRAALREMVKRMRDDVELLERQIDAGKGEDRTTRDEPWA